MSYDTVASLQRMQQLEQAQAAFGKRLVLKRVTPKVDIIILVITFLLAVPTLTLSIWIWSIYFSIKEFTMKTYLVKNVTTGEQVYVEKQDFKQYKRNFKNKEKQVRRISDL
ncbi:hypothetical protein [Bacillus paranthracis]|uniref:hypothetical protein n=1 Tax=Bacillus paranthracis TaxID=2026186 RepID=UPI0021CF6E27|nr:hypothetical protein [Bacillus paranthracis]MBR3118114.1 hypothetical protein [Oceanobacillus sp.]MCU5469517.1 hypothetical protein [Bacillus paranthracis]